MACHWIQYFALGMKQLPLALQSLFSFHLECGYAHKKKQKNKPNNTKEKQTNFHVLKCIVTVIPLPFSLLPCRYLASPLSQSWRIESGFVIISSCCQLERPLHLLTLGLFGSMGGGGWELLCRREMLSQWYEVVYES